MARKQKMLILIAAGVVAVSVAARLVYTYRSRRPVVVIGAIIRKDTDPRKQLPVANAQVTVVGGTPEETTKSDASGLFKVTVHPSVLTLSRLIALRFEHAEYQPLEMTAGDRDLLYVVRMEPLARKSVAEPDHPETATKVARIANVRVRYSVKNQTMFNVGSIAKQFEIVNTGDVPCRGQHPCSPDGKWKASTGTLTLDADKGNEFRNVRASCIAGPCPFTRLEPNDLSRPTRKIELTALVWSDTASFLVEAEVTRTMTSDTVRRSYPFIIGQAMSFALPAAAEGLCIIADVNGEEIVFPFGPSLILSWANCSVELAQGGNKLYRCEVKSGYQVQQ